jgi:hypothetical protein
VQIYGADTVTLKAAAEAVQTALAVHPEVSALEDSMAYDREELSLELTAQGEALGFLIDALGRVLRNRLGGIEAATFPDRSAHRLDPRRAARGRADRRLPRGHAPPGGGRAVRAARRHRRPSRRGRAFPPSTARTASA